MTWKKFFNELNKLLLSISIMALVLAIIYALTSYSFKAEIDEKLSSAFAENVKQYNDDYAYYLSCVKKTTEKKTTVNTPKVQTAVVTAGSLNVRSGPSKNFSIVTSIPKGTKVTIVDENNKGWPQIKLSNGTTGFVYKEYLRYN